MAPGGPHARASRARRPALRALLALAAACALCGRGAAFSFGRKAPAAQRAAKVKVSSRPSNLTHSILSKTSLLKTDPEALCADGTTGGAYYSKSFSDPSLATTWLVYLPGTSWCYSAESCFSLAFWHPETMSSTGWPKSRALGGLFHPNPSKNPFAGANMAYVGYCSGDAFLGSANQSAATVDATYHFQGRRILKAVFTKMVAAGLGQPYRINNEEAVHRILLAGGGAGGVGVMLNMDLILTWLVGMGVLPSNVQVQALLDASAWAPLPPPNPGVTSVVNAAAAALGYLNVTMEQLSAGCLAANTARSYMCLFAEFRLPYAKTPYLLYAPQFDKRQLMYGLGGPVVRPLPTVAGEYATALQASTLALLPGVRGTANAAFSPACLKGPAALHSTLWGMRAAGKGEQPQSLRDVLEAWMYANGTGVVVADSCAGFACGTYCRRNPGHPRNPDKTVTVHLTGIVAPPPPPRKFSGFWHWLFRLGVVAICVGVLWFGTAQLMGMAEAAGVLAKTPKPLPDGTFPAFEGTPLVVRSEGTTGAKKPGKAQKAAPRVYM